MAAPYQKMDEAVPRMMELLKTQLGDEGATRLCDLLQETGSLIAGGSVLNAYRPLDLPRQDIDIYVPVKNAVLFFDKFVRDPVDSIIIQDENFIEKSYKSTLYCNSFLHKNGIKKVYNFISLKENDIGRSYELEFDVMIVRNRKTPLEVVNNFDLTFCQIWFDGINVYASHPKDVQERRGTLQGDYVNLFLQGNRFLKNRIIKYGDRGYKVFMDEKSSSDLTQIFSYPNHYSSCLKPKDSDFLKHWSSRVLLTWFLGIRDQIRHHQRNLPPNFPHSILFVPLIADRNRYYVNREQIFGGLQKGNPSVKVFAPLDDGYDSEELSENESLYDILYSHHLRRPRDLLKEPDTSNEEEMKIAKKTLFYRGANKMFEEAMWPNEYYPSGNRSLGLLLEDDEELGGGRAKLYHDELKRRCIRKGTSFITQEDDVEVYDIHEHPMEAGISADDLEGYLEQHVTDPDKTQMPCYYQPNPANHDDPVNCKNFISFSEVKYICSKDFFDKYSAPPPQKLGLDQFMSHYDQTLYNSKEADDSFGLLYHHTVCPFCLQFESRDSGCSYMTHENRTGADDSEAPFCDKRLKNAELIERYYAVSNLGPATRLAFCSECGRPCVNHKHITTTAPYMTIERPRQDDYTTCTGGGRAELFARILAIRKVYREAGILDPKEERRQAILAADNAPNDPALMAQGQAIFEQEEATRHWTNAPIPAEKMYNDPAYKTEAQPAENEEWENALTPVPAADGGKYKHRKTVKKNRNRNKNTKINKNTRSSLK